MKDPFIFQIEGFKVAVFADTLRLARKCIKLNYSKDKMEYLGRYKQTDSDARSTVAVHYPPKEPSDAYYEISGLVKCKDGSWGDPRWLKEHGFQNNILPKYR
jgi:hypothetical protein